MRPTMFAGLLSDRSSTMIVCLCIFSALLVQANAQRSRGSRSYGGPASTLNYRWFRESNETQRRETTTDRLLRQIFVNHVDGFPYCGDGKKPLKLDLMLIVLAMLGVEESTKLVQLSVRFVMSWGHCGLRWNPSNYENIQKVEVPRSVAVWTPDLTWIERPERDFSWRTQARLTLNASGHFELVGQAIINHACPNMHFTMFPFDGHGCELTFVSLAHDGTDMYLNVTMLTSSDYENGTRPLDDDDQDSLDTEQWMVRLSQDRVCQRDIFHFDEQNDSLANSSSSKYSEATCVVYLRRHPLYHMFSLFTPAALITFLAAFAFLIPPNEADAKIGFALTIMLQLLVFMMYMYERLPVASTQIPLMTQYFSWCIAIVAFSVLMTVVIAYIGWLGDDLIVMPHCLDVFWIRMVGRLLVGEHLKVLRRWEAHVKKAEVVVPEEHHEMQTVLVQPPAEEGQTETSFSAELECAKERSEDTVQMRKPRAPEAAIESAPERGKFARSISRVEEVVTCCEDDRAGLTRARWALMALVVDKMCFIFFVAAVVTCIAYHAATGYQYWYANLDTP